MKPVLLPAVVTAVAIAATSPSRCQDARARVQRCQLAPLGFEDWRGPGTGADFVARGLGYTLRVSAGGTEMGLRGPRGPGEVVRTRLVGANALARAEAHAPQPGRIHYFLGSDPGQWRRNVIAHGEARYRDVYPGIDVVYHGNQGELEYDFVVAPGADPGAIRVRFEGGVLGLDAAGDLVVQLAAGAVRHRRPIAYQERDGARVAIGVRYALAGDEVRFELAEWDRGLALVIDPVVSWASYLGGSGPEQDVRLAVDANGFAYVTGYTGSANFPTRGPIQGRGGASDAFVTKFVPDGSAIVYSTYLGGVGLEEPRDIATAPDGRVAVVGRTASPDFPTRNAYQPTQPGPTLDAWLSVLDPSGGSLVYSTFYGGTNGAEHAGGVAFDATGKVLLAGTTDSTNLPGTDLGYQRFHGGMDDAFVAKFDPDRSGPGSLLTATYLGGANVDEAWGVAVSRNGRVCVLGRTQSINFPRTSAFQPQLRGPDDAFVTVLTPSSLGLLVLSTYFGGTGRELSANTRLRGGIAVDDQDAIYVTGDTTSSDFPTTPGAFDRTFGGSRDGFVAKLVPLRPEGALVWSTFLGGALGEDGGQDVAVDADGCAVVCGCTSSPDFPRVHPTHTPPASAGSRPFVAMLNAAGTALRFATTVGPASAGSEASGVAMDPAGNVWFTGTTSGYPATAGAFQTQSGGGAEAFVSRIDLPRARAVDYGTGLAGTLGVPTLRASAPPVLGTTITLDVGNSLGALTPGLLVVGDQRNSLPIFGGTLLVQPLFHVPLTIPTAGLSLPLGIRDDNSLGGLVLLFQGFAFDPGAVQSLAMTPGLELQVGI